MARLTKVADDQAGPDVAPIYDRMRKARGNVPNMFRTMAHRPEILKTMAAHFAAVMTETTLTVRLKELVVLRVSALNCTDYCIASHTKLALANGATKDEVDAALRGDYSKFSPRDVAAIRWGERVTNESNSIPEAEVVELKKHFTDGEIVELTACAGIFNYFNRFNNALKMEITT